MTQTRAAAAYYERLDANTFRATTHAQGAWGPDQQHMAPISGLMVRAIEECAPRPDMMLSRITFDILGVIPMGEVHLEARVIRHGRTIELVECELSAGGRPAVRATAWRLATSDTVDIVGSDLEPMPGPDAAGPWKASHMWEGGFIRSLEFRVLPGWRPGRGRAWLRTEAGLVAGADSSTLARFLGLVDTANGVAVRADPTTLLFPNTDLTVHLFRRPIGDWVGLDTSVTFGPDGIGTTASVLHDIEGPVGRSAQTLTLRLLPGIDPRPPQGPQSAE